MTIPAFTIERDERPLVAGERIQCVKCRTGIAAGKKPGIESGCQTVLISAWQHKGKVIAAMDWSDFVTVLWQDNKEPQKIHRREVVRIHD